jgi:hypothetical protein
MPQLAITQDSRSGWIRYSLSRCAKPSPLLGHHISNKTWAESVRESSGSICVKPPLWNLSCAMEDAAFVVGVVKFGAVWSDAPTDSKKCGQHAYRRCDEIDPEGVPITSVSGGAKGSRGVHAHSGERCFERDVHGVERTHKVRRVPTQSFVVRHKQYRDHRDKGDGYLGCKRGGDTLHARSGHCITNRAIPWSASW